MGDGWATADRAGAAAGAAPRCRCEREGTHLARAAVAAGSGQRWGRSGRVWDWDGDGSGPRRWACRKGGGPGATPTALPVHLRNNNARAGGPWRGDRGRRGELRAGCALACAGDGCFQARAQHKPAAHGRCIPGPGPLSWSSPRPDCRCRPQAAPAAQAGPGAPAPGWPTPRLPARMQPATETAAAARRIAAPAKSTATRAALRIRAPLRNAPAHPSPATHMRTTSPPRPRESAPAQASAPAAALHASAAGSATETLPMIQAFRALQTPESRAHALAALLDELSPYEWRAVQSLLGARHFHRDIVGTLPLELVAHVFSFLDPAAPFRLQRVSSPYSAFIISFCGAGPPGPARGPQRPQLPSNAGPTAIGAVGDGCATPMASGLQSRSHRHRTRLRPHQLC